MLQGNLWNILMHKWETFLVLYNIQLVRCALSFVTWPIFVEGIIYFLKALRPALTEHVLTI